MKCRSAIGPFVFTTSLAVAVLAATACGDDPTVAPATDGGSTSSGSTSSGSTSSGSTSSGSVDSGVATFTVSASVVGLKGAGLVLKDNKSGAELPVPANGGAAQKATFTVKLPAGTAFEVVVKTQPKTPTQVCTVTGGTGSVVSGNVESITVNCTTKYTVGGTVTGLEGKDLILQNNNGGDLTVNANGTFAFSTPQDDASAYAVTVKQNPTDKWQTCTVTDGSGTIAAADVSKVAINCATNKYKVGVKVAGLLGTGLVFQNNAADDLAVAADGTTYFGTTVASGDAYAITVKTPPAAPPQTCTVTTPNGKVAGADLVRDVACETNKYKVGGTLKNMTGKGIVLQNSLADDLTLDANGAFNFATSVKFGDAYSVTVKTQPNTPSQTCYVYAGTGNVGAGAVDTVIVDCAVPTSCKALKTAAPASASGVYTLNPPGAGGLISAYCDMATDGGGWTLIANRLTNSDDTGQPDLAQNLGVFSDARNTNWQFDVTRFYAAATDIAFASKHNNACAGCTLGGYDSAIKAPRTAGAATKTCTAHVAANATKLVGTGAGGVITAYWCDGALGWGNCGNNVCHYGLHGQNSLSDGQWSQNTNQEMHFPSAYSQYRSYGAGNPANGQKYCRSCSGALGNIVNNSSTCCRDNSQDDRSTWTIWVR
jgi:hypothetical protein